MVMTRATDIKVGDVIEVWWAPGRDTVTEIEPYTGPIEVLRGGFIFRFARWTLGMSAAPNDFFRVVSW